MLNQMAILSISNTIKLIWLIISAESLVFFHRQIQHDIDIYQSTDLYMDTKKISLYIVFRLPYQRKTMSMSKVDLEEIIIDSYVLNKQVFKKYFYQPEIKSRQGFASV